MITLAAINAKLAFLVGGQLDVEYSGENRHPTFGDVIQSHIDFILDPTMDYPSDIDDFTKKALQPMADKFANYLMEKRARKTFDLPTDKAINGGCESSLERFNGLSLRGLCNKHHLIWDEDKNRHREVEIYRFDVLFLPESVQ